MTEIDGKIIQALKYCLGNRYCIGCSLCNDGKAILTCRELLESLAEFAGVEIEKAEPKNE